MAQQPPKTIHHSHTTPPLLSPTWREVEELDDGLESDFRTCYLTLDFGSLVSMEAFEAADSFQLLVRGERHQALSRVGAQIFQGRHEELIGSELFFLPPKDDKTGFDPTPPAPNQSRIIFEPCNILSHEEAGRRRTCGRKTTKKPPADPSVPKRGPGRLKGSKNKPKPPPEADGGCSRGRRGYTSFCPTRVEAGQTFRQACDCCSCLGERWSFAIDEEQPVASGSGTRRGD
ncbi:hypothetical protein BCR35DRAFT_333768 [Leucosporidium creatinivorum]|uniref:Transcription factor TFIIIC triple barrel domain-containing protein n=1 Tax=Leucosporidium creatinivorum TaxID=106004 RepID=A0A1Y2EP02_9BASI|nr:hypothetical protein BCR35DRAFT_333768 [Leucosporidium creatinivorum]